MSSRADAGRGIPPGAAARDHAPRDLATLHIRTNPIGRTTEVRYELSNTAHVQLGIFTILGREVFRHNADNRAPGRHLVCWNGCDRYGHPVPDDEVIVRLEVAAANGSGRYISGTKHTMEYRVNGTII